MYVFSSSRIVAFEILESCATSIKQTRHMQITTSGDPCFLPKFFVDWMNHNLKNFAFKNLSGTNLKTLQKWYRLWDCEINRSFASESFDPSFLLANGLKWRVGIQQQLVTAVTLVELVILLFIYQILNLKHGTGVGRLGHYAFEGKTAWVETRLQWRKNFSPGGAGKDRTYESRTELELERCLRWKRRLKPELCNQI